MSIREQLKKGVTIYDIPLRVTFYARVSTDHELQATSIVNQVDYFTNYIKNNTNWTYIYGYVDEGISGKSTLGRQNFLKMIHDAKRHIFDLILTKSVSRFARNTMDSIYYTNILLENGVGVFFLNDNINTFYTDSEFRLTLMASIAQDELRKLSESVQFGLSQSIDRGVVLGNNNILGYRKDHGKLIIVKEEAKIVRDIFSYFVKNQGSYSEVSRYINASYHLKYDSCRIKRILTNYKYKGFYCGRKSRVLDYKKNIRKNLAQDEWVIYLDYDKVPPIVREDIWDKANAIILSRKRKKNIGVNVFCGIHKKRATIKRKKYKDKYYYYYVCPSCFHFSRYFLEEYFKKYSSIVIYLREEGWYDFFCKIS